MAAAYNTVRQATPDTDTFPSTLDTTTNWNNGPGIYFPLETASGNVQPANSAEDSAAAWKKTTFSLSSGGMYAKVIAGNNWSTDIRAGGPTVAMLGTANESSIWFLADPYAGVFQLIELTDNLSTTYTRYSVAGGGDEILSTGDILVIEYHDDDLIRVGGKWGGAGSDTELSNYDNSVNTQLTGTMTGIFFYSDVKTAGTFSDFETGDLANTGGAVPQIIQQL